MGVIRDMLVRIGVQADTAALDRFAQRIQHSQMVFTELNQSLELVGKGFAIWQAVAGRTVGQVLQLARETAEGMDRVAKQSQRLGLTTEAYGELAHAARLSGVEIETLAGTMGVLVTRADMARRGSKEHAADFAAYGVAVSSANGQLKAADQLLAAVADGVARLPTETERAASTVRMMGKEANKLVPLLAGGSAGLAAMRREARELGNVMSRETAAAGERYVDLQTRIAARSESIAHTWGRVLMPALERMAEWYEKAQQGMQRFARGVEDLTRHFGGLDRVLGLVAARLGLSGLVRLVGWLRGATVPLARMVAGLGTAQLSLGGLAGAARALLAPLGVVFRLLGGWVTVLALLAEDFAVFFGGGKSLVGEWAESLALANSPLGAMARGLLTLRQEGPALWAAMADGAHSLWAALQPVGDFLVWVLGLLTRLGSFTGEKLADFVHGTPQGVLATTVNKNGQVVNQLPEAAQRFQSGFAGRTAPTNVHLELGGVVVHAPQAGSPEAVGRAVHDATARLLERATRQLAAAGRVPDAPGFQE